MGASVLEIHVRHILEDSGVQQDFAIDVQIINISCIDSD